MKPVVRKASAKNSWSACGFKISSKFKSFSRLKEKPHQVAALNHRQWSCFLEILPVLLRLYIDIYSHPHAYTTCKDNPSSASLTYILFDEKQK